MSLPIEFIIEKHNNAIILKLIPDDFHNNQYLEHYILQLSYILRPNFDETDFYRRLLKDVCGLTIFIQLSMDQIKNFVNEIMANIKENFKSSQKSVTEETLEAIGTLENASKMLKRKLEEDENSTVQSKQSKQEYLKTM